jgi:hypothetical protein
MNNAKIHPFYRRRGDIQNRIHVELMTDPPLDTTIMPTGRPPTRYDSFGVEIVKGSKLKEHRVTFRDPIGETYVISNWKRYNYGFEEDERCC